MGGQGTKWRRTLAKISTGWVGCTSVTDRQTDRQTDRRTDGRQHIEKFQDGTSVIRIRQPQLCEHKEFGVCVCRNIIRICARVLSCPTTRVRGRSESAADVTYVISDDRVGIPLTMTTANLIIKLTSSREPLFYSKKNRNRKSAFIEKAYRYTRNQRS